MNNYLNNKLIEQKKELDKQKEEINKSNEEKSLSVSIQAEDNSVPEAHPNYQQNLNLFNEVHERSE